MRHPHRPASIFIGILGVASLCAQTPSRYGGKNGWYKGNTHIHTTGSDGELALGAAAKFYHDNDYDFIAITDHRVFFADRAAVFTPRRSAFLIIPGEEYHESGSGSVFPSNHTTVLNASGALGAMAATWTSKAELYSKVAALAASKGGFPILNHPNYNGLVTVGDIMKISGLFHFEIFNGATAHDNYGMYSRIPSTEAQWDSLLTLGAKFYGVGSDDAHRFTARPNTHNPLTAWSMLKTANLTAAGVLDAYRRGRFYATNGVILQDLRDSLGLYTVVIDTASTRVELRRRDSSGFVNPGRPVAAGTPGYRIDFIGPRGQVLKTVVGDSARYQATHAHAYVRARVVLLRTISAQGAPYDNATFKRADYVKNNNLTREEFHAWGQPYFTDGRREGPPLVFGCTNPAFLEYDAKANVMDSSKCLNRSVRLQVGGRASRPEGGLALSISPDFGDYVIEIHSLGGKQVRSLPSNPARHHRVAGLVRMGTYVVRIKGERKTLLRKITLP